MEVKLYEHLKNAELVGDSIYPQTAPDNAKPPYITYMVVTGRPRELPNRKISSVTSRIQIDVYEKNSSIKAKQLRDRVVESIRKFSLYSKDINWRDGYEPRVKFYRQIIEFYTKENIGECNGN